MAPTLAFAPATRSTAKARIALVGPSGSGKTYTALRIASALGKRIAVIDTEHGSASKYAGTFTFDTLTPPDFSPMTYVQAISAAAAAGYDVLVIDSLSHAWVGRGGALEMVDKAAKASRSQNTFAAWRDVTPQHNALVEAMLAAPMHLVVTMRAKTEYALEKDERTGKIAPVKIGLAPVQRDGMEYEFDVVGDLTLNHDLVISKSRCPELDGQVIHMPGEELGTTLLHWLSDGTPAAEPVAAPSEAAPAQAPVDPPSDGDGFAPDANTLIDCVNAALDASSPSDGGSLVINLSTAALHATSQEDVAMIRDAYSQVGGFMSDAQQRAVINAVKRAKERINGSPETDDTEPPVPAPSKPEPEPEPAPAPQAPEPEPEKEQTAANDVHESPYGAVEHWKPFLEENAKNVPVLMDCFDYIDRVLEGPHRFNTMKLWVAAFTDNAGPAHLSEMHEYIEEAMDAGRPGRAYVLRAIDKAIAQTKSLET